MYLPDPPPPYTQRAYIRALLEAKKVQCSRSGTRSLNVKGRPTADVSLLSVQQAHQGSASSCLPRLLTSALLDLTQARHQTTSALHHSAMLACLDLYSVLFGLCLSSVVVGPPSSREPCAANVSPTSGSAADVGLRLSEGDFFFFDTSGTLAGLVIFISCPNLHHNVKGRPTADVSLLSVQQAPPGSASSCLPRLLTSALLDLTQARHQTTSALHHSASTLYLGSQASTLDSCNVKGRPTADVSLLSVQQAHQGSASSCLPRLLTSALLDLTQARHQTLQLCTTRPNVKGRPTADVSLLSVQHGPPRIGVILSPRLLTSALLDLTQARHQTTSALHHSASTLYLGSQASTLDSCDRLLTWDFGSPKGLLLL
ncbi:hypothetical protein TYRP_022924 [Tyrophagus putrescentiae]|nr:hypothetical protein TYRP_022924 [Tyrophagus putrescentiae]